MNHVRSVPTGYADERGVIAVWTRSSMVPLLAFAGWAVDFSHWNDERTHMQKAADAAALAAAVYMPENINGVAFTTTKNIAAKNGYRDGTDGVSVQVQPGDYPNQLRVTIKETVKNTFAQVVGIGTTALGRHAVGEYQRPVSMGSPINQFSNDPELSATPAHGSTRYPDFCANIFGPSSQKARATRSSRRSMQGRQLRQQQLRLRRERLLLRHRGHGLASPLVICTYDRSSATSATTARQRQRLQPDRRTEPTANFNPGIPAPCHISRYNTAADNAYCTGDMIFSKGATSPVDRVKLRAPDSSPATPKDNPMIYSVEFPAYLGT